MSELPTNPTIPNLRASFSARCRWLGLPKPFWDARRYGAEYRASRREKAKNYARDWRAKNPDYRRATPGVLRTAKFISDLKSKTPCADCKRILPACCMDFDHLPGHEKTGGIAEMIHSRRPLPEFQLELLKCELVCANCHRIRTHLLRRLGLARR